MKTAAYPRPDPNAPPGTEIDPVELTDRQEQFCQRVAAHGNQGLAFREAYNVGPLTRPRLVWDRAYELARRPVIQARIRQLQVAALPAQLFSVRELVRDWVDIARADPNEIVRHVRHNCRNCRGVDHKHQWRDMVEYLEACATFAQDAALGLTKAGAAMPDMAGGFGFDAPLEPVATCPACYGEGIGVTLIADTTKLTGPARKLFRGIKETKNGIEVLLHDQEAAREKLGRLAGLFGDERPPLTPPADAEDDVIDAEASAVDAASEYQRLVRG